MVLTKPLSSKPRDVASKLAEQLGSRLGGMCDAPEIAGPGFINLRLKDDFVAAKLKGMIGDGDRLGIPRYVVVTSHAVCTIFTMASDLLGVCNVGIVAPLFSSDFVPCLPFFLLQCFFGLFRVS